MHAVKKINDSISNFELNLKQNTKARILLMFTVLTLFMFVLIGKNVTAATVNVASGSFADLYNTIMGFIYGGPGIIVAILMGLFGVVMMISKHWTVFVVVIIAIIVFFLIPEIVLSLASMGASLAGAVI
jgi:type IV secretory pathway VirB2 component (pilin)